MTTKAIEAGARAGHTTLRSANIARQAEWDAGNVIGLAYRGNELAGEVGEACNVIKKLERERHGIRGSRATVQQLAEELADIVICTDLIAMQAGVDLDKAVRDKFNATSEKVGLRTRLAFGELVPASAVAAERERCAKVADQLAAERRAKEKAEGYGPHTARPAANAYWCEEIGSAIRSLSPAPASGGWRDISTAPNDGRMALVFRPLASMTRDEPVAIKRLVGGNNFCWPATVPAGSEPCNPTDDGSCHVTHWMPLPASPAVLNAATKDGERA